MLKKIIAKEWFQDLAMTLFVFAAIMVFWFLCGCNPDLPQLKDYDKDMYPCYLADKCITVNGYKDANSQDCAVAIQKCFRYTDKKNCGDDKDCWDKLGVRY